MGYYFDEKKAQESGGKWTKEELEAGTLPTPADRNKLPMKKLDMERKPEMAGKTVTQKTIHGTYEVFYDDRGYAFKATRV